ncbi:MAG: glycosyltransferase, partial [Actinomycetota bacterium]|nr:glycosyltransferase [Actinomycetota bacterium]
MRPDARAWFRSRTTSAPSTAELDLPALLRAKRRGGHRVSVVLPARNEAATVGALVRGVRERWMGSVPLVDELLVVDSDSTDATAAVARAAGADVVATTEVLPAHGTRPGKGEALWKSLAATSGDLVVFL